MKRSQELQAEAIAVAGYADKKSPPPWGWQGKDEDQMNDSFQNVRKILDTTEQFNGSVVQVELTA
ncbi:MAG: hypothetical protein ACYTBJ_13275 [Planctomycetota bacterium]|jgi:hypothetical protein